MDVSWSVFLGHLGVDGDDCNSVVCHFKGCHCTRLPSTVFTALFAELIVHRGLLCPNLHTACMYLATQGSGYPSPSLPSFFGGSRGNNYLFSNLRKHFTYPFSVKSRGFAFVPWLQMMLQREFGLIPSAECHRWDKCSQGLFESRFFLPSSW